MKTKQSLLGTKLFLADIRRSSIAMLFMAFFAFCFGLLFNSLREQPIPLVYESRRDRLNESVKDLIPGSLSKTSPTVNSEDRTLSLKEFRIHVESKQSLLIDARPVLLYKLGHVPGSLSLPREDFREGYLRLIDVLEKNKKHTIVVYCSNITCEDSSLVQRTLVAMGYSNVLVFSEGWEAWIDSSLPIESGQ